MAQKKRHDILEVNAAIIPTSRLETLCQCRPLLPPAPDLADWLCTDSVPCPPSAGVQLYRDTVPIMPLQSAALSGGIRPQTGLRTCWAGFSETETLTRRTPAAARVLAIYYIVSISARTRFVQVLLLKARARWWQCFLRSIKRPHFFSPIPMACNKPVHVAGAVGTCRLPAATFIFTSIIHICIW